jgi:hypothetical protein
MVSKPYEGKGFASALCFLESHGRGIKYLKNERLDGLDEYLRKTTT